MVSLARGRLIACLAAVLVTTAWGIGYAIRDARTPEIIAEDRQPARFPVVLEQFTDPRQVSVVPTSGPIATVVTHRGGVITRSACQEGGSISAGTAPWAVDGHPVLAIATSEPPFRNLSLGAKGADVASLQHELQLLGYSVDEDGVLGRDTGLAISAVREKLGMGEGTSLALEDVTWLPMRQVAVAHCTPLGAEVEGGEALAQGRPALVNARVTPMPQDLVDGARTLTVGGLSITVGPDGSISKEDLPALDGLPETALSLAALDEGTEAKLTGVLELADPLATATLPASAIVISGPDACVLSGRATFRVEVVSSQLGQSIVAFGSGQPPKTIEVSPNPSVRCN